MVEPTSIAAGATVLGVLYILFSHPNTFKWVLFLIVGVYLLFKMGSQITSFISNPIVLIFIGLFAVLILIKKK